MEPERFCALTALLTASLEPRPEVQALVLLGSTAGSGRAADSFSDHDFFVFVDEAAAERYRQDLSWLPDAERLVLVHRETEHGLKLLYDDGHLMECAIFTPAEARYARGDVFRVAFDKGLGLEETLARQARTPSAPPAEDGWLSRQLACLLLVGAGRFRRGERLAGHRLVFGEALPKAVELFARHVQVTGAAVTDPLDPMRRFERARPALGRALSDLLSLPADEAALQLLDLLEAHLEGTPAALSEETLAAVRARLSAWGVDVDD